MFQIVQNKLRCDGIDRFPDLGQRPKAVLEKPIPSDRHHPVACALAAHDHAALQPSLRQRQLLLGHTLLFQQVQFGANHFHTFGRALGLRTDIDAHDAG